MSSLRLDDLPADIHYIIYSFCSIADIRKLACVNHRCLELMEPFLYRDLKVHITTPKKLENGTFTLKNHYKAKKFLQYARHLEITGSMVSQVQEDGEVEGLRSEQTIDHVAPSFSLSENLEMHYDFYWPNDDDDDDVNNNPETLSKAWEPLILILPKFKHLADVVYSCTSRLPSGFLAALSRSHPSCRLHMRLFRFRGLNTAETDSAEHELVTSSHLHSLSLRYTQEDSHGNYHYGLEAMIHALMIAPNLKHLRLLECFVPDPPMPSPRSREPWGGFRPAIPPRRPGSLITLSFPQYSTVAMDQLFGDFEKCLDFSTLKSIQLPLDTPRLLTHMAMTKPFPVLEELNLGLELRDIYTCFRKATDDFLRSLKPLVTLGMGGAIYSQLLNTICESHGQTLKTLHITPSSEDSDEFALYLHMTAPRISFIAQHCPLLSDLDINIMRYKSDRNETKCYKVLGALKYLETLTIHLWYTFGHAYSLYYDLDDLDDLDIIDCDQEIEDFLVNAATDETLARSIWHTIVENSDLKRLRNLQIFPQTYCRERIPSNSLSIIESDLARWYRIKLQTYDKGEELNVVDLAIECKNKDEDNKEEPWLGQSHSTMGFDNRLLIVFDRLWPFKASGKDWRTTWKSWPLQHSSISTISWPDEDESP